MKTFKSIGIALLAVIVCVNLAACSDDDDEPGNTLSGTTRKIMSSSEDGGMAGIEVTFRPNGTLEMSRNGWTYANWSLNGDVLTLTVGESAPDDFMKGTISINENTATYVYHWGDVEGEWEDEDNYTMILQKQ